jgi:ribosomal-protein-alanine N-acetyltransferase
MTLEYAGMLVSDIKSVVEAEQRCHEFPWTAGNFADSLAAGYGAWVAREGGRISGYAVMMRVPDEAHLLNITILPELQRGGRGSALLRHLFAEADAWGATRMLLEVRPGNVSGLALYRRHGFAEIGRRRGYYPAKAGREDAIVMACGL